MALIFHQDSYDSLEQSLTFQPQIQRCLLPAKVSSCLLSFPWFNIVEGWVGSQSFSLLSVDHLDELCWCCLQKKKSSLPFTTCRVQEGVSSNLHLQIDPLLIVSVNLWHPKASSNNSRGKVDFSASLRFEVLDQQALGGLLSPGANVLTDGLGI